MWSFQDLLLFFYYFHLDSVPTAEAKVAILLTYVRGLRTERRFRCLPVIPSLNSQDSVPTAEANFATLLTYVRGLRTERRFSAYNGHTTEATFRTQVALEGKKRVEFNATGGTESKWKRIKKLRVVSAKRDIFRLFKMLRCFFTISI